MRRQGVPTTSPSCVALDARTESAAEAVFLVCAVLGTVAGAVGAAVCSALLLDGGYLDALAIAGGAVGCWVFASLGALAADRTGAQAARRHEPAAGPFGDAAPS